MVISSTTNECLQVGGRPESLFPLNKTDLAPYVGASLEVMARDAETQRKSRPFVMTNMKTGEGVDAVIAFLRDKGGLKAEGGNAAIAPAGSLPGWRGAR